MRKLDLILENIRDEYMINLLEEGEVSELEALKTKKFLNESLGRIRGMLVEEGTLDAVKQHLANNWGKYLAGLGAGGAGLYYMMNQGEELPGVSNPQSIQDIKVVEPYDETVGEAVANNQAPAEAINQVQTSVAQETNPMHIAQGKEDITAGEQVGNAIASTVAPGENAQSVGADFISPNEAKIAQLKTDTENFVRANKAALQAGAGGLAAGIGASALAARLANKKEK